MDWHLTVLAGIPSSAWQALKQHQLEHRVVASEIPKDRDVEHSSRAVVYPYQLLRHIQTGV